jgi:hypothetical protein
MVNKEVETYTEKNVMSDKSPKIVISKSKVGRI